MFHIKFLHHMMIFSGNPLRWLVDLLLAPWSSWMRTFQNVDFLQQEMGDLWVFNDD